VVAFPWKTALVLATGLALTASGCKDQSSAAEPGAQQLRTCVDRWNQANMVDWGRRPASVSSRRPTPYERSYLGDSGGTHCFVVLAATPGRAQTYSCVLTRTGAYACPSNAEGSPPLRNRNATVDANGRLSLEVALQGTHAIPTLPWQQYPRRDGFVDPWTPSGTLRTGLTLAGKRRGPCPGESKELGKAAVLCLTQDARRFDPCFPQPGATRSTLAACGTLGSTVFVRWTIARR
jgi:hypothetical protein